ncbi:MAG: hypothetical protein ACYCT0_03015 [Sulfobacillus sp.]
MELKPWPRPAQLDDNTGHVVQALYESVGTIIRMLPYIAFSVGRYPLFVRISLTQGIIQVPSAQDIIALNPLTDTWPPAQQERKIKKGALLVGARRLDD